MATIRRRATGTWQAQVRLAGLRPLSRTFQHKADAQHWAKEIETQVQRGDLGAGTSSLRNTSLSSLIERYRDYVTPHKRGRVKETALLNALLRHPFTRLTLSALTPQHFSEYRDLRYRTVRASTINHALALLNQIYKLARSEWGIPVQNPLEGLRRPKADPPRNRRLMKGELDQVMQAADTCRNVQIRPFILFALETAMRRGEILGMEWIDLNQEKRTLRIPLAKNGHSRTIPLSEAALAILSTQRVRGLHRPFPLTVESFDMAWKRLIRRSGINNLHFHDLRHEAITALFERGLTMPEVALISGHRDPRMLFRYTHLRAEDVVLKLR